MKKMYLLVDVIGTDCTANGITSGQQQAALECVDGFLTHEQVVDQFIPILKLFPGKRNLKYVAAPIDYEGSGKWYMFGGHFIYSSDSRFPSDTPIHVHDRNEG